VNDARGAAGNACSEVILLDQQNALSSAGELARHRHAIDSAANHHHVKVLAVQAGSWIYRQYHMS
jgi:hypothetical protein